MVIFDNNALVFLYRSSSNEDSLHRKIQYLFQSLEDSGEVIGIPAQVLSEFLIGEKDPIKRREFMLLFSDKNSIFQILPYDATCAITNVLIQDVLNGKPNEEPKDARQKIKVDRQILALSIAKAATKIITHDKNILSDAKYLSGSASKLHKVVAMDIVDIEEPASTPDMFGSSYSQEIMDKKTIQ